MVVFMLLLHEAQATDGHSQDQPRTDIPFSRPSDVLRHPHCPKILRADTSQLYINVMVCQCLAAHSRFKGPNLERLAEVAAMLRNDARQLPPVLLLGSASRLVISRSRRGLCDGLINQISSNRHHDNDEEDDIMAQ